MYKCSQWSTVCGSVRFDQSQCLLIEYRTLVKANMVQLFNGKLNDHEKVWVKNICTEWSPRSVCTVSIICL